MASTQTPLAGFSIMVAEDEYFIALHLHDILEDAGARIVGPYAHLDRALSAVDSEMFDACVLNTNLGGVLAYPIAARLLQRGIPFAFVTGYGIGDIPPRWRDVVRWDKLSEPSLLIAAVSSMIARSRVS